MDKITSTIAKDKYGNFSVLIMDEQGQIIKELHGICFKKALNEVEKAVVTRMW